MVISKNKMLRSVFFVLLSLVWSNVGQCEDHPFEFSINPGISVPVGPFSDSFGNSAILQGSFMYQAIPWLAAGLDAGYSFGHTATPGGSANPGQVTTEVKEKIFQVTPAIRIGTWQSAGQYSWMPYAVAGAGFYSEQVKSSVSVLGGGAPDFEVTSSHNDFGLNVGAGAALRIADRYFIGAELRYHRLFSGNVVFKPTSDDIRYIAPVAKFGLFF